MHRIKRLLGILSAPNIFTPADRAVLAGRLDDYDDDDDGY